MAKCVLRKMHSISTVKSGKISFYLDKYSHLVYCNIWLTFESYFLVCDVNIKLIILEWFQYLI